MLFNPAQVRGASVDLNQLLNTMPSMTWCADAEGLTTFVNTDILTFTGRHAQDFLDLRFTQAVHPSDRLRLLECWQMAWQDQNKFSCEFRFERYDGTYHWVRSDARPLLSDDGTLLGWLGNCTLIHDLKVAQERTAVLQELGSLLQTVGTTSAALNIILNRGVTNVGACGGAIGIVRQATNELLLVTEQDCRAATLGVWREISLALSTPGTDTVQSGTAQFFRSRNDLLKQYTGLRTTLETNVQALAVLPLRTDDQTKGVLLLAFDQPQRFDDQERAFLSDLAHLCAQVMERTRLLEDLQRSEQRHRTLFDALPNILWSSTQEGQVLHFNEHWRDFTGLPSQPVGLSWTDAVHPEDRPKILQARNEGLRNGTAYEVEFRLRRHDGAYHWHFCRVTPLRPEQATEEFQWLGYAVHVHDRVMVERTLERSEARLRSLVTATTQIVWTTTPEGELQVPQPDWTSFTGQGPTEYAGWGWNEAVHPEDREVTYRAWSQALKTHQMYEVEHRLRRHDGQYQWFLVRAVPVFEETGELVEWIGIHSNVHQQKRMELHRAQLERLVHESHDLIGMTTLAGRLQYLNPAGQALLGLNEEGVQDTVWSDVLPPEAHQFTRNELVPHVLQAGSWVGDINLRHIPTGQAFPVSTNMFTISDPRTLTPKLVAITARDVRERQAAEAAQRELNALLRQRVEERSREVERLDRFNHHLLDSAGEGVFGLDLTGRITFANRAALKMTGFALEDMLGHFQHDLLHPPRSDGSSTSVPVPLLRESDQEASARSGEAQCQSPAEATFLRKDGSSFPVEYTASPVRGNHGDREGTVVTFRDVTQRQRSQEALLQANRELKRSNQDLEEFAYVTSHDLQEPLRSVASFTELLVRRYGQDDTQAQVYANMILDGVHRMKAIIQDLLTYSRVRAENQQPMQVDLEKVMQVVTQSMHAAIEHSAARISWDPLPTVTGDSSQLTQIFQNLLSNALKFRSGDQVPVVHVGVEKGAEAWLFEVRDNGIGIDAEYFDRIFDVFQRLHRREQYEGTGMGLAIVKRVVDRHQGQLWVTSTVGEGTTFHFTLPIV
ncbi:PAS domain S-box protein [Deinococcus hopiensis]|uniref:histidine kinase n=1 Tax=Deinococcus hopiensis KR-140 TaxID=695939 RepID=A0A1W1V028_9DEIO|nr:PAS domain S-box protein [Deinococcus hopiensis]SMB86324.1 PAS domain S-box-containing protein [Deinococcus hopiensis KR-140]